MIDIILLICREFYMNIHDLQLHFSIRKLSVGVVSCLIGICFISSNQTVQADSMPIASNNKSVIISNSSSNSNPTETIASKSNNKQNIVDSNNTSPTQNNSHSNRNSTKMVLVNSKLNISSQQPAAADSAENKLKTAALNPTIDEKLDAKMLAESKATAQAKDTNGGFDKATWGTLNVNNWKGEVQGDYYQLTDYTGDANHVIVPNEADFAQAGISTGKQVGVTSALMHTIFKDRATANNATVAFSKTDNKMVKAIGSNWSDTWGHALSDDSKAELSNFDGTNLDVSNVTDMRDMFYGNNISDLSPLANWKVDNVTDMRDMFYGNNISDLSPLSKWNVDNVTDMSSMFSFNNISDLSPLSKWHVDNVANMRYMFYNNKISDLSPLADWNVVKVTDMNDMFSFNNISDLSRLSNWKVDNVTNMCWMFYGNNISDLSPLANWNVAKVTNMLYMFGGNNISDLKPLTNWNVSEVTNMHSMFERNNISDLSPLANWNVAKVTDMSSMFLLNNISDLSPLANWKVDNVTNMRSMFDNNSSTQTENVQAERVINFFYPAGYTGKKQYSVTQTVDVSRKVRVKLTTNNSQKSNHILDWVTSKTSYSDWSDEGSTTTVDGQNNPSLVPYVIRNGQIMFAPYKIPRISGYKAVLTKNSPATSLFMPSFLSFTYVPLNDSRAQKPADKPVDLKDNQGKPSASPAPTVPVKPVNPAPIVSDQGKEKQPVSTPVNDPVVPEEPIVVAGQNDEKSDVSHPQDIASKKQDNTKPSKKVHVSPISDHDSGANKKNSKITNTAASASDKSNRNTPIGGANDEANKTNRTVQAAVVNNDKNVLPQTGASQNKTGIIGMVFASLAGMLGLAGTKKKRKND